MNRGLRTSEVVSTAILTALAIMIPLVFTFPPFRITIPPFFTATLMSHVPSMLSIFLGPFAAVGVGLGSALGFTWFVGPVVGARAITHALFALVGNWVWRRGASKWVALLVALPFHAVGEYLVVRAFGVAPQAALITLAGTAAHHVVDAAITLILLAAIARSGQAKWLERSRT